MEPVVLITGGAHRLGKSIASAFAQRGYRIAISFHESNDTVVDGALIDFQNLGAKDVIAFEANLEKVSETQKLAKLVLKQFGRIDVLINSAAIFPDQKELGDVDEKFWDRAFSLNLKQQFFLSQEVIGIQQKLDLPLSIVNLTSLGGLQTWKGRLVYNVSKAALIALTKSLAREVGSLGMRVNSVAPGAVDIPGEMEGAPDIVGKEYIPMSRYAKPEEIASAVVFLALDATYITGQTVAVDGGRLLFSR